MNTNDLDSIPKIEDLSILDINVDKEWERFAKNVGLKKEAKIINLSAFMKIAAAVLIVLGVGFSVYKFTLKPITQTFVSLDSQVETIVENSTKISLNKNSSVTCKQENNVFVANLKGQAYFDVEKNPKREFRVKTSNATVIVHGTSFDVCEKNGSTIVTVTSGNVSVKNDLGNEINNLTIGKQLVCFSNGEMKVSEVENFNSLAWKLGKLEFKNTPMKVVVNQLSKLYDFEYCFESDDIANMPITGEFENQSLESVLSVLEQTLDVNIVKESQYYKFKK